jgi:hypothetical protein
VNLEKVLEKLAVTDKAGRSCPKRLTAKCASRQGIGRGKKVFGRDQVLEVRNVEGRL